MARNKDELRRNGYYYIEGKTYISVTHALKIIDKPQLLYWAAKTAATYAIEHPEVDDVATCCAEINKKRDKAGDRGSTVHGLLEAIGKGNKPDISEVPPEIKPFAEGFLKFADDYISEILMTECVIVSDKYGYAGTCDLIFKDKNGITVLGDYKTSGDLYPEYRLQVVAYKHGDFIWDKVNEKHLELPKIDKVMLIHLNDKAEYKIMVDIREPLEIFLCAKTLWEWKNGDEYKTKKEKPKEVE